ncbi:MAG: NAD-glutamate dehydrogenase, partial [Gammaproteobacteria bacterium]
MATKTISDNVLLAPVLKRLQASGRNKSGAAIAAFAEQFFASSAQSELQKSATDYLFETAVDNWKFIQTFASSRPKIEFRQAIDRGKPVTRILILQKDMPFIVDSVRQGINLAGYSIKRINNTVIHASRVGSGSKQPGKLRELSAVPGNQFNAEAVCCIHCAHIPNAQLQDLEREIREILKHVAAAVRDFRPMCNKALAVRDALQAKKSSVPVSAVELAESCEFIEWLIDNHFTFLGYEEYRIRKPKSGAAIELKKDSLLGISRYKKGLLPRVALSDLPKGTGNLILKKQVCNFAKSATLSKVHRPVHYDYVLIKEFDNKGEVAIEHRFVGLYTSSVYYVAALEIPLVRIKVNKVLAQSGFSPNGHSIKDLLQVINVFPRDELFQIKQDQLFATALEIARIQETRTSKLFIRRDSYGKFFSCLVYLPRDNYNTRVRVQIQEFLKERLQARSVEFNIHLSESLLARIHFVLRVKDIYQVKFEQSELEREMSRLIKPWDDSFLESLLTNYSEPEALALHETYGKCFPGAYKEAYDVDTGVEDLQHIEKVLGSGRLAVDLAPCDTGEGAEFRFKIFSKDQQIHLSNVAPILENLGLNIISEYAFRLSPGKDYSGWLHDFSVYRKDRGVNLDADIQSRFEQAFYAVWSRQTDDDSFNALVFNASLGWRDAALLRAYAAYLKQVQFGYSAHFIAETLARHSQVTRQLVEYFGLLFRPGLPRTAAKKAVQLRSAVMAAIDEISNLSEDSVLRAFVNIVDATLRSNFFQPADGGGAKDYFSFKIDCARVDSMPRPRPMYEIFVYSPQVEGVHLRGGKVARGGLRWSDRREDYRTEVLGLVKAQQVKNSVIVPVGAKGGFVMKQQPLAGDRDAFMAAGIECYKTFISGLLDITDNLRNNKVLPPKQVVRRDEDDPYLVVAADKGTASFSDIANGIAAKYGFWLGDGFASGGSKGYDHKQMGITARGAWVSVQRHFRELGINVQDTDFTVVGIGDMSGDVFGNGMLLSEHICLVAAFNHLHIFIDPDPDSARSFKERQRLFDLPRSGWNDYKPELISRGGGVFLRSAKSITLTAQIKQR